jgi:hypothetical protein
MMRTVLALLLALLARSVWALPITEIPIPPAPRVIEHENLGEVDFNGIGLTPGTAETGGFWHNSTRSSVEPLLAEITTGIKHPAIKSALLPVLIRGGNPPRGYSSDGAPFLVARATALYNQGAIQEAKQLLALVPQGQRRFAATQLLASMLVVEGKFDAGCPVVTDGLAMQNDALLLALQYVCATKEEKPAAAELALSLLDELTNEYSGFLALAQSCTLGVPPNALPTVTADTATTALLRVCRWPQGSAITLIVDRTTPVPLLPLIATSTLVSTETRVRAAELATLHGAFSPVRLKEVYDIIAGFSDGQDPASMAYNAPQVWQQFKTAKGVNRWQVLSVALEGAGALGTQPVVARLYQPLLQDVILPEEARLKKAAIRTAALSGAASLLTGSGSLEDTTITLYSWGWARLQAREPGAALWDVGLLNRWRQRFGADYSALPLYLEALGYPAPANAAKRRLSPLGRQLLDAQKQQADGLAVLSAVRVISNSLTGVTPLGDIAVAYDTLVSLGFTDAARSAAVALSLQQGL